MKKKKIERCCGNCCFMKFEDTDGDAMCMKHYTDDDRAFTTCYHKACKDFISHEEKLKHFRNLLELKRLCDKYNEIKGDVPEIFLHTANSISFAIDYIKTFNKL